MKRNYDVVIVDDDLKFGKYLLKFLENFSNNNIKIKYISKVKKAIAFIEKENPRVGLIDITFKNDPIYKNGLDIIEKLSTVVDTEFVVITGKSSTEDIFRAGQLAVQDICEKTLDFSYLSKLVNKLIEKSKKIDSINKKSEFQNFVGISNRMKKIKRQIKIASENDLPVLITGDTGVGKDVCARLIHLYGSRKKYPFRTFDAGSIDSALAAKELFGNVKGAFTGADKSNDGLFREADKGSLFIDEIGNMSLEIQKYFLRALNSPQKIRPLGSSKEYNVDVRIILATNNNLLYLIENNLFRKDLYARIDTPLRIYIPPLVERREDIPVLIQYFINSLKKSKKPFPNFSNNALDFLENIYDWPMNIRQIDLFIGGMGAKYRQEKKIKLSTVMENLQYLRNKDFDEKNSRSDRKINYNIKNNKTYDLKNIPINITLKKAKEMIEKVVIENTLNVEKYKIKKTAEKLGVSREYLYFLVKKYDINLQI